MKPHELKKEIEKAILKFALKVSDENLKKHSKAYVEKRFNLASDILLNPSIFASKFVKVFEVCEYSEKEINKFVIEIWDKMAGVNKFDKT